MSNLKYEDDERPSATEISSGEAKDLGKVPLKFKNEPTLPLEDTTYELLVELSGRGATTNRLGADIVMVLDVSGSMEGKKLLEMKQALQFVIRKLSPSDRLSIVTFASDSERKCLLRNITPDARDKTKDLVNRLKAGGSTNIAAGLQLALKVLNDRKYTEARSSAIMLMSDGIENNKGDASQISVDQYPVFTFGFGSGSEFDSEVLQGIAMKSHGGTFSLANPGDLSVAFSQCLGGLLSVLVQDVKLILTTRVDDEEEEENEKKYATIKKVKAGNYPQEPQSTDAKFKGTDVTVSFGNLYQNEIRSILVSLMFPLVPNNETVDALELKCTYRGENSNKITSTAPRLFRVKRSNTGITNQSDPTKAEIARIKTLEMMKEARDLADNDGLAKALDKAAKARNVLDDVQLQTPNTLIETLKLELHEMIKFFQTSETYTNKGRSFTYSSETSHSRQRFASRGDSEKIRPYATPRMDDYLEQAKEFKKDPSKPPPTAAEDDKKELAANPLAGVAPTLSYYLEIAIDALQNIHNIINKKP